MTKQDLLDTGYFIDNKYLDAYLQLVSKESLAANYLQIHHILPRQYYKKLNIKIDNSSKNTVKLSLTDHIKAHWYLSNCTTSWLQAGSFYAIRFLFSTKVLEQKSTIDSNELTLLIQYYEAALLDHCRPVVCLETKKHYKSLVLAAFDVNLCSIGSIEKCCNGKYKTAAGYHWVFEENLTDELLNKYQNKRLLFKKPKKVICLETLIEYSSPAAAAKQLGISEGRRITWCCNNKAITAGGYHWAWADTNLSSCNQIFGKTRQIERIVDNTKHKVKCIELNITYNSISEAAELHNIARNSIRRSIKFGYLAGNYHWKTV